jgi:hypothetical protein
VRHHIQPRPGLATARTGLIVNGRAGTHRKVQYMRAGVGHCGVFSGKRWNNKIYPLRGDFVHVNSRARRVQFTRRPCKQQSDEAILQRKTS